MTIVYRRRKFQASRICFKWKTLNFSKNNWTCGSTSSYNFFSFPTNTDLQTKKNEIVKNWYTYKIIYRNISQTKKNVIVQELIHEQTSV